MFKRKRIENTPFEQLSLLDLLKEYIYSRLPAKKSAVSNTNINHEPRIPDNEITHIAIVLDGVVEDVMRAQNRLAALLLSEPEFVEFDPQKDRPQIGLTEYVDKKFKYKAEELMSDDEIEQALKSMGVEKDEE